MWAFWGPFLSSAAAGTSSEAPSFQKDAADPPLCSDAVTVPVIDHVAGGWLPRRRHLSGNISKANHHPEHKQLSELCKAAALPKESGDKSGFLVWRKPVGGEAGTARRHDGIGRRPRPRPRPCRAGAFGKTVPAPEKWRTAPRHH